MFTVQKKNFDFKIFCFRLGCESRSRNCFVSVLTKRSRNFRVSISVSKTKKGLDLGLSSLDYIPAKHFVVNGWLGRMHPPHFSSGFTVTPDNDYYCQLKKRAFFPLELVNLNYFYSTTASPEIITSKQLSILFTCPV